MRCRNQGSLAFAFGLGLISACIFPDRFIVFVAAIIVILLGIALSKC